MAKVLVQLYFNKEHTLFWHEGKRQWGIKLQESSSVGTFYIPFSCFYQGIQISISRPFSLLHPLRGLIHKNWLTTVMIAFLQRKQLYACACTTRSNSFPYPPTWNSLSISFIPGPALPDSPFFPRASRSPAQSVEGSLLHSAECIKTPHQLGQESSVPPALGCHE